MFSFSLNLLPPAHKVREKVYNIFSFFVRPQGVPQSLVPSPFWGVPQYLVPGSFWEVPQFLVPGSFFSGQGIPGRDRGTSQTAQGYPPNPSPPGQDKGTLPPADRTGVPSPLRNRQTQDTTFGTPLAVMQEYFLVNKELGPSRHVF